MMSYEPERALARDAARAAGRLCMAIRDEMLRGRGHMEKDGREPVTLADYGAQAVVMQHVAARFPEDASLAEERGSDFVRLATPEQQQRVAEHAAAVLGQPVTPQQVHDWLDFGREATNSRVWVVDPIDGTKGFMRGDQFAVAVALVVDGEPVVGALACPLMPFGSNGAANPRGSLALAVRGQGATIEPLDGGPERPARVSQRSAPEDARLVESVEVGHTDHAFSSRIIELTGLGGQPVRIDSQAKYAAVADGRAEVYIRRSHDSYRERVWDHAAGMLIVEEAGGRVTDLLGQPLDFRYGSHLEGNRGILATNGALHDELLEAIAAVAG